MVLAELNGPDLAFVRRGVVGKTIDPTALWQNWSTEGPAVLLESAGPLDGASQWLILAGAPEKEFFGGPDGVWWKNNNKTFASPFGFWEFADQVGRIQSPYSPLPFCLSSAWFGVLSYDFGRKSNLKNPIGGRLGGSCENQMADFHFFKPSRVLAINRETKEYFLFGVDSNESFLNTAFSRTPMKIHGLRPQWTRSQYESMARRAQEYIAQGDIYQANIAQAFQAQWEGNAGTLYRILRELNPGPFMGLFQGRDFTVVSSSPERLAAGQGDWLETRPIAGTRRRGKDGLEDLQMKAELKSNPKEQAEHLMLVDLARNDLGRVSNYGTVEVSRYAEVESYAKVHHLVSTVQSQRRKSAPFSEILRALFPGGTITGCPKIRCMEIIEALENSPRGFYTGSMGYLTAGPCFDFNILIRSFTLFSTGLLEFHAGAGIVADSDPSKEYMETLYKVEALAQALGTSLTAKQ